MDWPLGHPARKIHSNKIIVFTDKFKQKMATRKQRPLSEMVRTSLTGIFMEYLEKWKKVKVFTVTVTL